MRRVEKEDIDRCCPQWGKIRNYEVSPYRFLPVWMDDALNAVEWP